MQKTMKSYTSEQALSRLQALCARAERSSCDVLRLLRRWQIPDSEAQRILTQLCADRYVDDDRYAAAYVRDRMRFSGWGALKIRSSLRAKGIRREIVDRAMAETEAFDTSERLASMLATKAKTIKSKDVYDLKAKLIRFGLSRGFAYDEVFDAVGRIVAPND